MKIDTRSFPYVWLNLKTPSAHADTTPFSMFEELLNRREPFVFINEEGLEKDEPETSKEDLKQTSLWMKRHKDELRAYVKAAIYIEDNYAKRLAAKAFASVYEKFWGYPMLIVENRNVAMEIAEELLKTDTPPLRTEEK